MVEAHVNFHRTYQQGAGLR